MDSINETKSEIQHQTHRVWLQAGGGTICAGTGFGKSRIPILEIQRMVQHGELTAEDIGTSPILLVTPTIKLRDENWPNEFAAWGATQLMQDYVKRICFASLKNEKGNHYKLVILDEAHHLTQLAMTAFAGDQEDALTRFLRENLADRTLGLTATVPNPKLEKDKYALLQTVAPVVFTYSLDQGVSDGMIADYEIRVIEHQLDKTAKVIPAGTKKNPFLTTEEKQYQYLEKTIRRHMMLSTKEPSPTKAALHAKLAVIAQRKRNLFLATLPSKTAIAARCLRQITAQGKRTLVFCGGIAQCNELLSPNVYHSESGSEAFDAFCRKEIDTLGVVAAADEGLNFPDLDQALIVRVYSSSRKLVQQTGRLLRIREGHKGLLYILVTLGTSEERWLENCLSEFDPKKVRYFSSKGIPV